MKKIFLAILLTTILLITGCRSENIDKIKEDFIKDTNKLTGYYLEGILNLTNNDDTYQYDVSVSYAKGDYYKVSLINKSNDYEQIMLRNDDGVYVITQGSTKQKI